VAKARPKPPQNIDFDGDTATAEAATDRPVASALPLTEEQPAVLMCQRCNVACEPVPRSRGMYRCPECGWRHKPFTELRKQQERRRAAIVQQSRAAR